MKRKIASLSLCLVLVLGAVFQSAVCAYAATNPFTKTGNMAQDMVNAALAQQNKKVADFSGMPKDNWCAYFICWCANASGASAAGILPTKYSDCSTTGKVAYWAAKHKGMVYVFTADGKSKMQQNAPSGNWSYVSQSSVTPKVGDIALFHWKGASGTWNHVGIVYKVDSSKIYYVDGNGTSGGYNNSYVTTHTLSRTSSEIAGYIRPAYSGSGGTVSSSITLKSASYTNLKENSVQVRGTCQYSGIRPSEVGLYFGTSPDNMKKVDSDQINHTKNPFDIWYDRSGLTPGTTYYWRLYALVNGKTVWNSDGVQSFRTPGTAPVKNYTLSFQTNRGSSISPVTKTAGTSVSLSGYTPSRTGYTFAGWYSDSSLTKQVTSVTLNSNMTVYARWLENEVPLYYRLSFQTNGGSSISSVTETAGTWVSLSDYTPSRTGYTFGGWYSDSSLTNRVTSVTLNSNMTVYARWLENEVPLYYRLSFQTNGGSSISSVTETAGTWVSLSGYTPSRTGYIFGGWYSDSSLTNRVTSVTLNSNMTVYAKWTKEQQDDDEVYVRGFTDVLRNSPYASAVRYVYDNGLMNGVSLTRFEPVGSLSRAMIVTILYRQEGSPSVSGAAGFLDVPSGQWYSAGVAWAAKNGIVNGYGNGSFGPDDNVSREQMLTILYRYAQQKGIDTSARGSLSRYPDAGNISSYAEIPYRWAIAEGVIAPLTSNLYPAMYAFRGEAAVAFKALNEI